MDANIKQLVDDTVRSLHRADPGKHRVLVLFSGVPGSGKSTVAKAIEETLGATRLSNDEVRVRIKALRPKLSLAERETIKGRVMASVLTQVLSAQDDLVVIDASCDRNYDFYAAQARQYNYTIILLRMDIPRQVVELRLAKRSERLDTWWRQWRLFGETHKQDVTITLQTPAQDVCTFVAGRMRHSRDAER